MCAHPVVAVCAIATGLALGVLRLSILDQTNVCVSVHR